MLCETSLTLMSSEVLFVASHYNYTSDLYVRYFDWWKSRLLLYYSNNMWKEWVC